MVCPSKDRVVIEMEMEVMIEQAMEGEGYSNGGWVGLSEG